MPTLKGKHSVFESIAQRMDHVDPASIGLLGDRVLLKDLPGDERVGSIWLPETCQNLDQLRWADVVAVGPGDAFIEYPASQTSTDSYGYVPMKRYSTECRGCGKSVTELGATFCFYCYTTLRLPMHVLPGDRVLYNRRMEAEIEIEGQRYGMVHEEQAVIGVMHDGSLCPLRDRILVNRDAVHQKVGSLFIPEACAQERPEGRVVAVGPGKIRLNGEYIPPEVKVGDHVVFQEGAGSDIEIGGQRVLVMRESDVLGVME